MFLQHKNSGDLVEILTIDSLFDPCRKEIMGRFHCGEEMQDSETFSKLDLTFPYCESLPICWLDPTYRERISTKQTMVANI